MFQAALDWNIQFAWISNPLRFPAEATGVLQASTVSLLVLGLSGQIAQSFI